MQSALDHELPEICLPEISIDNENNREIGYSRNGNRRKEFRARAGQRERWIEANRQREGNNTLSGEIPNRVRQTDRDRERHRDRNRGTKIERKREKERHRGR